jgi:hypothetical protein
VKETGLRRLAHSAGGDAVIDPNRVGRIVCLPGERVRAELGFRWDAEPQVVQASFRKFVGSRFSARNLGRHIVLEGREFRRRVEEGEAYMSVILEGVIPGSIDPGTYDCRYVHFLMPGRGWVLAFEDPGLSIKVVGGLPTHREREGAQLFGMRFLG